LHFFLLKPSIPQGLILHEAFYILSPKQSKAAKFVHTHDQRPTETVELLGSRWIYHAFTHLLFRSQHHAPAMV